MFNHYLVLLYLKVMDFAEVAFWEMFKKIGIPLSQIANFDCLRVIFNTELCYTKANQLIFNNGLLHKNQCTNF